MTSKIELRPATLSDFIEICGANPPCRFRGLTVYRDDEPVAIAGLRLSNGAMEAFSSVKPGVTYPKKTALRVSLEIADWMRSQCSLVYITLGCDKNDRYHRWIGFEPRGEWEGQRVYQLCHN